MIDTESEPGAWADAIRHSPWMDVADYEPAKSASERSGVRT